MAQEETEGTAEATQEVAEAPVETAESAAEPSAEEPEPAPEPEPEPPPPEMPEDRILDPAKLRFWQAEDGSLRLEIEGERSILEAYAARAFPISARRELICISDGGGEEVGVLRRLRDLPRDMRRLVLEALRKRYFVPQITYVHSLKEEFGVLYWDVDTTRGRRQFVVREPREMIREFEGGRLQITDVDGNYFEVADLDALKGKGVVELYRLM